MSGKEGIYTGLRFPPAAEARPYTVINMVSSVDGEVSVCGRAGGIGGEADRRVMRTLRSKVDAVVGTRVFLRHNRFRLVLGPLRLREFLRFLPDGDARAKLAAMVRRVPGPEMDWDTQLVLRRDEVPATALDGTARLGWTSWLPARNRVRDAGDVVLLGSGGA